MPEVLLESILVSSQRPIQAYGACSGGENTVENAFISITYDGYLSLLV